MSPDGRPVHFVADAQTAPANPGIVYARPDDRTVTGQSWRELVLDYNAEPHHNPLGLYPAFQLYENRTYGRLVDQCGLDNVFILSAGWGLISAGFLTPYYDITFSPSADAYKRRRKSDRYDDLCLLKLNADDILFFGGKDYLPLFCALTRTISGRKTVFYNSAQVPQAAGCILKRFETTTRTNWHYECANAFLDGSMRPAG
jgi:hypothetical protein